MRGCWDRLRVSQVVTNLLVERGEVRGRQAGGGRVRAAGRPAPGCRSATAASGSSRADQPQIFERFERAVSSRNYGGLGLGLYIVKRIVESHGGTIRVESTPGEGSAFVVELPLRPAVAMRAVEPHGVTQ